MADTIRVVEYFYVVTPDKPGEGARVLNTLKEAGVNLLALSGFPGGRRWQLDLIPADPAAFRQAAKHAKWKVVGPKRGFLVQGDDRVGAVAEMLARLGDLISVNVRRSAPAGRVDVVDRGVPAALLREQMPRVQASLRPVGLCGL
jgi:hypothetical protein